MNKIGDIIKEMKEGKDKTPRLIENYRLYLVPMRITGTGESEREIEGQTVKFNRLADFFLSDDFAQSCISCPVIYAEGEHTQDGGINKTVGVIAETYADNEELWGIVKITDESFFAAVEKGDISTSPFIVSEIEDREGVKTEVDGDLIHLAIVTNGYWDNEKDAIGGLDKSGGKMTEEEKKELKDSIVSEIKDSLQALTTAGSKAEEETKEEETKEVKEVKDEEKAEVKDHEGEELVKLNETLASIIERLEKLEQAKEEVKTEDSVEGLSEDEQEKEELIKTISEIADSARGFLTVNRVKIPSNAKKSEILRGFISANISHVRDENKVFGEIADSRLYKSALVALDDIRAEIRSKMNETKKTTNCGFAR